MTPTVVTYYVAHLGRWKAYLSYPDSWDDSTAPAALGDTEGEARAKLASLTLKMAADLIRHLQEVGVVPLHYDLRGPQQ